MLLGGGMYCDATKLYRQEKNNINTLIGRKYNNSIFHDGHFALLEQYGLSRDKKILDIGSGDGALLKAMVQNYAVNCTAVERDTHCFANFQKYRAENTNIQYINQDIFDAVLEKDTYDLCTGIDTVWYVNEKEKLFQKILDALKVGGYLFFTDLISNEINKEAKDFFDHWSVPFPYSCKYMLKLMADLGFELIEYQDHTHLHHNVLCGLRDKLTRLNHHPHISRDSVGIYKKRVDNMLYALSKKHYMYYYFIYKKREG